MDAAVKWLSMQTHNTGVVSSIPQRVTFKTPLARKAIGNHLMKIHVPRLTQSPVSGFLLRSKLCMRRSRDRLPATLFN